jgi:hypothetical protein
VNSSAARPSFTSLLLIAIGCAALAWFTRTVNAIWVAPQAEYVEAGYADSEVQSSPEADGLYHMRRVHRAIEEGQIAGSDPRLNFPHGSMIPWPPYADSAAFSLLGLFAPEDLAARRVFIETWMARLPFLYGVATSFLLALFAGALLRSQLAAIVAGSISALSYGAVHYSVPGIADHHAWVSMLNFLAMLICTMAWRRDRLMDPHRSLHLGGAAGVMMGLSLGSWVASLLWLGALQLGLFLTWLRARDETAQGLRNFGLAFHAAALLLVLPAAMSSPWVAHFPWMVVNLSWFHPVVLLLGLLVFLPKRGGRVPVYAMPVAILVLGGLVLVFDFGPGAGIREGYAWVSRADEFMSGIAESSRLFDGYRDWVGYGFFLLPLLWLWLALRWWRGHSELAALLVLIPLSFVQALTQIRFVEAAIGPAALAFAWACTQLPKLNRSRAWISLPTGLALGVLVGGVSWLGGMATNPWKDQVAPAQRHLLEWIDSRAPSETPIAEAEASVLAPWDWGHAIEWRTGFASLATNFGSYVGFDGYRAPAKFFLSVDREAARALLAEHRVRYVVRNSRLSLSMEQLQHSYGEGLPAGGFVRSFTDVKKRTRTEFTPLWFDTMAAALGVGVATSPNGAVPGLGDPDGPDGPGPPIDFLRLVHVSPIPDDHPAHGGMIQPHGLIWEHVPGAAVSIAAEDGQSLRVELGIRVAMNGNEIIAFLYRDQVAAGGGRADLRLPYNTALSNGDAEVAYAKWELLAADGSVVKEGALIISEEAVVGGLPVPLD